MRDETIPDTTDSVSLAKSEEPRQAAAQVLMGKPRNSEAGPGVAPTNAAEKPTRSASTGVRRTPENASSIIRAI